MAPETEARKGVERERLRVFYALWPSPDVARRLHALAEELQGECGGRAMRAETLHLTLAFVGDQPRARVGELSAIGSRVRFAPFNMRVDTLGCWMHNRILWAGCATAVPELGALAATLNAQLEQAGFPVEKRDFTPHMTLLRKISRKPVPREFGAVSWSVRDLVLVAAQRMSDGAHYRVLERWVATC